MKRTVIILAAALAAAGLCSCNKAASREGEKGGEELALLSINIKGVATKAADTAIYADEGKLGTVDVYVFDADNQSPGYGMLEAFKSAESSEISSDGKSATVKFTTSTGKKNIYVVANAGRNTSGGGVRKLANTILTESDLKAAVSELSDNSRTGFIMGGAREATLAAGAANANKVEISLKRLVARIKIGTVTGAFTAPRLQQSDFSVTRIYLMNVPKQAKYVNGGVSDIFGENGSTAISAGGTGYPATFSPSESLPYYLYSAPDLSSQTASGMYSYLRKESWTPAELSSQLSGLPENVKSLTCLDVNKYLFVEESSGNTFESGHVLQANQYFYTYPNPFEAASTPDTVDNTTKLVIETSLKTDSGNVTYYYPISIPYVQPNYAYTIGDVTIKRLGSTNPFTPVSTAECTFTITVKKWDTGDIVGSFNNETSSDNFEI